MARSGFADFLCFGYVQSFWQLSWDKVCFIPVARDWLCFCFAELLESFPFLGSLLVSRNCRLSGLVCDLWGPWRWLFGSRICDAASLVSLADVRAVCDGVTSLFICCCPLDYLSMLCTLIVPLPLLWPGCASGAEPC